MSEMKDILQGQSKDIRQLNSQLAALLAINHVHTQKNENGQDGKRCKNQKVLESKTFFHIDLNQLHIVILVVTQSPLNRLTF